MNNFINIRDYIKTYTNQSALEIGGPTLLFNRDYYNNSVNLEAYFELYSLFKEIDSINLYDISGFFTVKHSDKNSIFRNKYSCFEKVPKNKYDYLLSSHTLEHIANPIKFLKQYITVLKKGGYIITFLPNKNVYWDNIRNFTSFDHIIDDYKNDIREDDKTHVNENLIVNHPYKLNPNHPDKPNMITWEEMCNNNEKYRVMHHHCFNIETCIKIHEYVGFETITCFISSGDPLQLIYFGKIK